MLRALKSLLVNSHAKGRATVIFAVVCSLLIFTKNIKNMIFSRIFILMVLLTAMAQASVAQNEEIVFVPKKFYLSNDFDGSIISTAFDKGLFPLNNGVPTTVGTPRFTYFFNTGFNVNFDFNQHLGLFSGLSLKNIGFIEKITPLDSTVKRRVYTLGVPLGIRVGNIKKKNYAFVGGGVDIPFNYKEKGYVRRGNKVKFNEWFSDRTPSYMAYGFVGVSFKPGFYVKVQYYPGNFMNPGFTETITVNGIPTVNMPYAKYDIEMLMFSIGVDLRYGNKLKIKNKESAETIM